MLYILAFFAGLYLGSAATAWQLIRIHRAALEDITESAQKAAEDAAKRGEERAAQWARDEERRYREADRWEELRRMNHDAQLVGSLPNDPVAELVIGYERAAQIELPSRAGMSRNHEEFRRRLARAANGS